MSLQYSDAARRMSDAVNLHITASGDGAFGKWVSCKLTDGSSDGNLYDRKEDAIHHAILGSEYYAYVHVTPGGMSPAQAERYLKFTRQLYDMGARVKASDGDRTILAPMAIENHPGRRLR